MMKNNVQVLKSLPSCSVAATADPNKLRETNQRKTKRLIHFSKQNWYRKQKNTRRLRIGSPNIRTRRHFDFCG